ncbi:MAG: vWA domain-containing protein, partial [Rivularia sp. (in: cyanobacteria)]
MLAAFGFPSMAQVKVAEIVDNPTVNDDRVTVRIKVKGAEERPVMGLEDTDFNLKVDGEEVNFNSRDWKSPEESTPPPVWIVVLLDMSGSMESKSQNTRKLDGAINAIRQLIKVSAERGKNTQIAIVPFGESGPSCSKGYPIDQKSLDNFSAARDAKLTTYLDNLQAQTPCASTNLYEPLKKTIRFLGNSENTDFYPPEDSGKTQPRLSIILVSDGYHNKGNEAQEFQKLSSLLKRNNNIIIHTLGYGLTPKQLGEKYNLGRAAT